MLQSNPIVGPALAAEITRRRGEALAGARKAYPQHSPRASNIHACQRNIVYQVLAYDQQKPWDDWMLARFARGTAKRKLVIEELRADGFEIIDQDINGQLSISIPDHHELEFRMGEVCTGRIDGLIKWEGKWLAFDVKSVNPNKYSRINTIADFEGDDLYRKYLKQLTIYMVGRNVEESLFILTDCLGHRKIIPYVLDYGEAEWILKHLEGAARHIKAKTYPDRIPYDQRLCGKCQFAHICLPDITNRPADLIDNETLELDIARHEELKPLAGEFEALHDQIKETFKGIPKAVVGIRWMVQSIPSQRTAYELTPEAEAQIKEIKAAHAKKVPVERLVIQDLMAGNQA